MGSNKRTARIAGLLYLIIVFCGIFSLKYVPSKLIVQGNGLATIRNISTSETLFRLGILSELIGDILFILLPLVLYKLFMEVNKTHALLMVSLIIPGILISFVNLLNKFVVLTLISKADYLKVFATNYLQAQILLYLDFYNNGNFIAQIFWGLWLFPFGYLVFKSRFLPKVLGILMMAGCFGYLINFIGSFLFLQYDETIIPRYITLPASIGELGTCLWLLIMGVRDKRTQ